MSMFTLPEQLSAASKSSIESQLALFTSLSSKAFEGVEKLIELNITAARASIEESTAAARQLFAAKDPQEWLSLTSSLVQPAPEKFASYGRQVASITSSVQSEFTKAAETQITENSRKVLELIEELSKNAPAGSENFVTFLKSAVGNATAGYEQLNKTTKQAAETIEANLNTAVTQFAEPVAKAARAATVVKK
jgi:phasin family protein